MSSNASAEEQPLLKSSNNNNIVNGMGKGLSWESKDHRDHVSDLHIHVDSLHNGLSRREKNGEAHSSPDCSVKINLPPPEREEPRFPPEKFKTFLGFVFLSCNMAWTLTVLAIVHERMPDRATTRPLPDIFFDIFPPVDWALDVSEVIIIISVWLTVLMIIMHKHRFILLRRCFVIIGLLYFMRSITMFVTQVPVASTTYYCSPKANTTSPLIIVKRVLSMMSGFGLSINGKHTFCGDYIYSGHTVVLTMSYLVIREYSPRRFYLLHWFVWLASCIGIFMVLLSRGHYTVDVVLGYYVTTRVFWIYHTMANNAALKVPGTNNFLSRIWWFSIFNYFEKNVGGVVPRQYEWPLPWPRRFSRHTRIS
ncbi:Phosphatidylcholine:ceramide like protein [Argiope bruennichi]|uniref:Phosphatidylcholine:ceramide like protein n=1 Tax=Argiope bruennichi TaxID=94029 RepID=A0A8T0EED7_ARGBR|nr:Phosphatidylcholine:ceramide like protein [Argiope bruennichi]